MSNHVDCDGAFFGTTFPHLFFLNFEQLVPRRPRSTPYVPKVFGFRIHSSSKSLPQCLYFCFMNSFLLFILFKFFLK